MTRAPQPRHRPRRQTRLERYSAGFSSSFGCRERDSPRPRSISARVAATRITAVAEALVVARRKAVAVDLSPLIARPVAAVVAVISVAIVTLSAHVVPVAVPRRLHAAP